MATQAQMTIGGVVVGGIVGALLGRLFDAKTAGGPVIGLVTGAALGGGITYAYSGQLSNLLPAGTPLTLNVADGVTQSAAMNSNQPLTIAIPTGGNLTAVSVDGQAIGGESGTSTPIPALAAGSHTIVVNWTDSTGAAATATVDLTVS
jgi:hypothetical protein